MMKKLLAMMMAMLLCAGPLSGCETTREQPKQTQKKTLLFQVDEGVGGYEFIAGYGYSRESLDMVLGHVVEGIGPLREKYDVAILIYPIYYYKESGWGKDPKDAINKFSDDFLYAMDFFEREKIKVYLEIMSSGVYTNQNGELGNMPLVDIFNGLEGKERREVKGLSMDMAAVAALKKAYPQTFEGLRFHELIGTNALAESTDPWWAAHGYQIFPEDLTFIINTVKQSGLKLIFSDHAWEIMDSPATVKYWDDITKYAEDTLQEDCTFTWANNSENAMPVLNLNKMAEIGTRWPNSKMGLSNQNWFQTAVMLAMNDLTNEYPESDMPLELTVGFTFRAFERGASLVQFEAPYQFFNYFRNIYVSNALGIGGKFEGYMGDTTAYEHLPDFSPRYELKRFVKYLLNPVDYFNDIENFYDSSLSRLDANTESDPPKVYTQDTISTYGGGEIRYFDKYINDTSVWRSDNDYRLGDWFYNDDTLLMQRFALSYNDNDTLLSAKKENGKTVAYLHNVRNSLVYRDESMFADDGSGRFVAFTCANLIAEPVVNTGIDTDEVIVLREKDGVLNFSMYKVKNNGIYNGSMPNLHKITFLKLNDEITKVYMQNIFGSEGTGGGRLFAIDDFMSVHGIRNRNSINKDRTRPVEGLALCYRTGGKAVIFGKRELKGAYFENEIAVDGQITCLTTGDVDMDRHLSDELIIQVKKGGQSSLVFAEFGDSFRLLDGGIDLGGYSSPKMFHFRKSFYQRAYYNE